ncbi:MAG: UDP-N-acetylglucosamine 1-carboxyvinyltransferase [Leptospirales bacterium]
MEQFVIEGGIPARGTVKPQGNKNEALPVICAAILNPEGATIKNIPDIQDVRHLIKLLEHLGVKITPIKKGDFHNLRIDSSNIHTQDLPEEISSQIRGSVTLMGALLGRTGRIYLPRPGGDKIGRRRIDTHLLAMEALGATVRVERAGYYIEAKKLRGAQILLDEASVTGTENAIMAASVAQGITIIENAASEPHVQGLCRFMIAQGVKIEGIGSNILTIHGIDGYENLKPADHTIGPDYLEIGSFISIAALTGGEITISDVYPRDLRMIKMVFERLGIIFDYELNGSQTDLIVPGNQSMKIRTDVHGEIPKLDDAPWPAFPADMVSIALVAATQCDGTILIHEKMFESRLYFTDKLISMGAKIVLCDPHRAVVIGPSELHGATLVSPDIRAGMALVIAALGAKGVSHIQNIIQVDRGYEKIDERLRSLGLEITRVKV